MNGVYLDTREDVSDGGGVYVLGEELAVLFPAFVVAFVGECPVSIHTKTPSIQINERVNLKRLTATAPST